MKKARRQTANVIASAGGRSESCTQQPKNGAKEIISGKVHANGFACSCDVDSREYKKGGCYCGVAEMEVLPKVHSNGFACVCDVDSREYKKGGCYCGVADMEPEGALVEKEIRTRPAKVCYNCGEEGHLSFACTKPRTHNKFKGRSDRAEKVCRKCGEKGHLSFECTLAGIKKKSKARRDWLPGKAVTLS